MRETAQAKARESARTVLVAALLLFVLLLHGCPAGNGDGSGDQPPADGTPPAEPAPKAAGPLLGANFVRFYWDGRDYYDPESVFGFLEDLGPDAIRSLHRGEPRWSIVEPTPGEWHFDESDGVIRDPRFEKIVRLFSLYWQSCTPPWATDSSDFVYGMDATCEEYVRTVVSRYRDEVDIWEIGNEMERWSWYDDGGEPPSYVNPPKVAPPYGFSTAEQGRFLAAVAGVIHEEDPDATVLLPALSSMDEWSRHWLSGVIADAGTDWFDAVSYHYYGPWQEFLGQREDFADWLAANGMGDKPVWQTETGATSDPTLSLRTDYPNSPEQQAADVFRRIVQGFAEGDRYVGWHALFGGTSSNDAWRYYGLRLADADATPQPAWYSYQLLASEVMPIESVTEVGDRAAGQYVFAIDRTTGDRVYVAWGEGSWTRPEGVSEGTSVVPDPTGAFSWMPAAPGEPLGLSEYPILLR